MSAKCPTCGFELSADQAEGLCWRCLGRLGFLPQSGTLDHGGLLRLGDYELLEEIARGGMGVVYRARQLSLNRTVALKVLLHGPFSSPDFVRRFRNEADAVAALRHPNIVAIYEIGEHDGNHFLSLEFVEGVNFAELVRQRPLPARRAAAYLRTIAQAVQHAHQRGVLHRDLKPSNILLDVFDQPRVTDFGLAKLLNSDAEPTAAGQLLGSPNYMPPEQSTGKLSGTPQSDIYSLGAILYELLTGRPPFQGESVQSILTQVQERDPVPPRQLNPGTPMDLQTICLKCLQKEPARRYASAQELADDLGRFLEYKPILARRVSPLERAWLWCRRHPLAAGMSAALVATGTLGVAGITWQWRQAELHAQGELRQRLMAEKNAAQTRLNLYAADMAVAWQAIQKGNLGLARRTLAALRPAAGETDLRGFEWRYLWNLCQGNQLATLTGHTGTVTCAAFSPQGNLLASGSHDGTVRIWDAASYKPITTLKVTSNAVWSVAFTLEGQRLMTVCNQKVQFWDVHSWQALSSFPGSMAALSATGTLLATAESSPFFWEPAGAVKLWDWPSAQLIRTFEPAGRALALSAQGRLLAIAGAKKDITVWETATGKLLRQWPTKNPVWCLNFSPDSRKLLSAGWQSGEVSIWNLDGHSPPQILSASPLHTWSAIFSADGAMIATTSSDQTARLWDAATLKPKGLFHGHNNEVWCAAFSPDGQRLATGGKDQTLMLWPSAGTKPTNQVPHDMDYHPVFSPDGRRLVTVNPGSAQSLLWDAASLTLLDKDLAGGRRIVGFSRDGKLAASFEASSLELQFWAPQAAAPQRELALDNRPAVRAQFVFAGMSPEQEFFFGVDADGLIRLWKTDTGALARAIKGPLPPIRNALLSPQGKQLAVSVERENAVRLYDCGAWAERQLAGHLDFVSGLAFSPDGTILATGSMDGTIRLWNTVSGQTIGSLPGHMQETTDVAFAPDGRTLASLGRDESLKLWHLPTLREVFSEELPEAGSWLRFSPDGSRLAVEISSDTLRLLTAPPERPEQRLPAQF